MIAVILAAGQGTRLQPLTNDRPKALVDINGKALLRYLLDQLPDTIDQLLIVTGYKGEMIQRALGSTYQGIPTTYVQQRKLNGTAGALWDAKKLLDRSDDPFLVLHGDNVFDAQELAAMTSGALSFGVFREVRPTIQLTFDTSPEGRLLGAHIPTSVERAQPLLVCTGSYALDRRIFTIDPVSLESGELGLPQTVVEFARQAPVQIFEHKTWIEVNTVKDLETAQNLLR